MTRFSKLGSFLLAATLAAAVPAAPLVVPAEVSPLARQVAELAARLATASVLAPDRFEILAVRFDGADDVPAGTIDLEPVEVDGPNDSGTVRIELGVDVDGTRHGRARATVRGEVRGPVLVATKTLVHGEPIPADSVEVKDFDLGGLASEPVRDLAELSGRVPRRTLGAGRAISVDLVGPASVVHRNGPVDLFVRRGALTVRARGIAKTDGAPGDVVPAVNAATGTRLVGRVQEDGSLLVLYGTSGRIR